MNKSFGFTPVAVWLVTLYIVLVSCTINNPYDVLNEHIKAGNLEEVRQLLTPVTRVDLDANGQPCVKDGEPVDKRRRLNEDTVCLDPAHDNNHAAYLALEYGRYDIVDLLLRDLRVRVTVDLEDILLVAIDFHHNRIAERILSEMADFSLEHVFVRTCEANNADLLMVLVTPERLARLNLASAVPIAIISAIDRDDCGEVLYFIMTCPHISVLHLDQSHILDWAMEHKYDSILALFFSNEHYIFDTATILRAFLLDSELSPFIMLLHKSTDIAKFEEEANEMEYETDCTILKLFKEATSVKDFGVKNEFQYPLLAVGIFQNSPEKINLVLEHTKKNLPPRFVHMLLMTGCLSGNLDALHALLRSPDIYWLIDEEILDGVAESLLGQGDAKGLKLILSILSSVNQDYGIDDYIIRSLKEVIDDGEDAAQNLESLDRALTRVLEYAKLHQEKGTIWLAALIRLSAAHHNAMLTIAARPFYFPPEVVDMILMEELLNLESFLRLD